MNKDQDYLSLYVVLPRTTTIYGPRRFSPIKYANQKPKLKRPKLLFLRSSSSLWRLVYGVDDESLFNSHYGMFGYIKHMSKQWVTIQLFKLIVPQSQQNIEASNYNISIRGVDYYNERETSVILIRTNQFNYMREVREEFIIKYAYAEAGLIETINNPEKLSQINLNPMTHIPERTLRKKSLMYTVPDKYLKSRTFFLGCSRSYVNPAIAIYDAVQHSPHYGHLARSLKMIAEYVAGDGFNVIKHLRPEPQTVHRIYLSLIK
jgi:hypothetical protein